MAEQQPQYAIQPQTQKGGPTTTQVLAVITLFPLGGILLTLAGLTLTGTIIGLALATPLFVIFSPVLVPAVFIVGLAVTGFLTSGAIGLTGFSSLSWIARYMRRLYPLILEKIEQIKSRVQEAAGHPGHKTRDIGPVVPSKPHEGAAAAQRK